MGPMRASALVFLAVLAPAFLAGCACDLEEAAEVATRARSERDAGHAAEALRALARAGDCIRGDSPDDPRACYLLAAVYFNLHLLGAPSAFPAGDAETGWALEVLRESRERDFLALAFRDMLSLEQKTFTLEGVPDWATVDRLLISADELRARADALLAGFPPDTFEGVPPEFAAAHMRLAVFDISRGFCVQAWRRALDTGQSVEPARTRLTGIYRSSAEAWDRLANVAAANAAKKAAEEESARLRGLAERSAILINPEDLNHPVEREMLKLLADEHLEKGRGTANRGFEEKLARNFARAAATLRASAAHFLLALSIGGLDDGDRRGALGYLHDLMLALRELER
ncbi:MAG: hypothetical protein FD180_4553 [Planctomycetota bacterium]|nr:MAG: hypothetical protein FD180_4553 [Planctomycetota bacterium]